jgi:hypothetical protein
MCFAAGSVGIWQDASKRFVVYEMQWGRFRLPFTNKEGERQVLLDFMTIQGPETWTTPRLVASRPVVPVICLPRPCDVICGIPACNTRSYDFISSTITGLS